MEILALPAPSDHDPHNTETTPPVLEGEYTPPATAGEGFTDLRARAVDLEERTMSGGTTSMVPETYEGPEVVTTYGKPVEEQTVEDHARVAMMIEDNPDMAARLDKAEPADFLPPKVEQHTEQESPLHTVVEGHLRDIFGVDRKTGDPLQDALNKVIGIGLRRVAERVTSHDPRIRVQGARVMSGLLEIAQRQNSQQPERAETPEEKFGRLPLSGEEAQASLIGMFDSLRTPVAGVMREQLSLSPDQTSQAFESQDREPLFTDQEEPVAAIAIGMGIAFAQYANGVDKWIRPEAIWSEDTRRQVETVVLEQGLVEGTDEERKAIIASVYTKLPQYMRLAFEQLEAERLAVDNLKAQKSTTREKVAA